MNYNLLNYIDNGIIIEDIQKEEIFFINNKAKLLLKTKQIKGILKFSQFFSNSVVYKELKQEIQSSLTSSSKFECTVYFRCFDNTFLEVKLYCDWFQKDENLVCYMFKSAIEVAGENNISFKELAEQLPSGIIVMNVENGLSITYANSEHYKILGIPHNSTQEKTYLLKDFVFEEDVHWVLSETYLNLSKNEDVDIEFRMKTQDNVIKWVRLFGRASISDTGEKLFYSSIKDLSHRRSINDKLHLERVMFYKITELTNEVLFRLDLQTHMIYFLGSNQNVFGSATVYENYPHTLMALKKVHPDDDLAHQELVYCLENGIEKEIDIRYLVDKNANLYEWFRISYSFIKNNDGSLISAIGKMSNINTQKLLEERAKMDLLTGFYNKLTTEQEIKNLIANKNQSNFALFIIDIDNFKSINDNLGHHFGDMVLVGIADDIKSCFKETDILGRIGGDEFLVVIKDVDNTSQVLEIANKLCNLLNKSFSGGTKVYYKISASIGISMYPNDGGTFEDLYQKSDIALYKIKDTNKNGYKLYQEEPDGTNLSYVPKKVHKNDNRASSILINNDIISTVVNLLYESKDIEATIFLILEYIGNVFKAHRCYIFETDDYGKTYNDTYDWCKNKKTEFTKNISLSNITNLIKSADDDGVFYTNDIANLKDEWLKNVLFEAGVESIFFIDSKRKYNEKGILFIEDCVDKRNWAEEDVFTLMQVSKIIFNTLNKHNIIKTLNSKNNITSTNYLSDNNSVISQDALINTSKLSDIINQYYICDNIHTASIALIQNIAKLLKVDKVNSIAYNKNTASYVKYFSYTLDTNFSDFSQVSTQQYKDCMDILNSNQDENILYLLKLLNHNDYLYVDDYHSNKDKLDKIGFTPINTEHIEEVFIFLTNHEYFTGYTRIEE
ncbi:MAG: diguanylate cyclase, partial [bacterium]